VFFAEGSGREHLKFFASCGCSAVWLMAGLVKANSKVFFLQELYFFSTPSECFLILSCSNSSFSFPFTHVFFFCRQQCDDPLGICIAEYIMNCEVLGRALQFDRTLWKFIPFLRVVFGVSLFLSLASFHTSLSWPRFPVFVALRHFFLSRAAVFRPLLELPLPSLIWLSLHLVPFFDKHFVFSRFTLLRTQSFARKPLFSFFLGSAASQMVLIFL